MRRRNHLVLLAAVVGLLAALLPAASSAAPPTTVTFTILHTNDFHGQLEWKSGGSSSNPGMARVAAHVNSVRSAVGAGNVLLVDAGDEMQGSLLSNIYKGEPTIATYNEMGYNVATFGNHEFDWGKTVLGNRVTQADYPYVSANIVVNDTGSCSTAGWTSPPFVDAPYFIQDVGVPTAVKVGFIGVTTPETPVITIAESTAGLCFKDPADSISHYYDAMKAAGADVIVVLSHLGYTDGGYGYGIPIYGDQTLAQKLTAAGKPVNLIIGGHSHTALAAATVPQGTTTQVVQAAYNGRRVGRADVTVNTSGAVSINWSFTLVPTAAGAPVDTAVADLIASYANDPAYIELINEEIGWTNVPITRNYDGDALMGYFVNDAIYNDLNTDTIPANDVDMVFNNPGGLRADIVCAAYPCKMTYGMLYNVLPFGNATAVGTMTGAQVLELLNQAASLNKGAIQGAGLRYKFYNYRVDLDPTSAVNWKAWSWGATDACVIDKGDGSCDPLDLAKTYTIATNEFLAPAGQDNFYAFKYVKDITYWGDMLNGVNRWVKATYPQATPYNGALDGRITREGDDTSGPIIPVTILHHNDSHGNLAKGTFVGYTQLASLIKQERAYNPDRTILLSSGDNIQGDAMMYYFKSAPLGYAADGTPLVAPLTTHPMMAVMNAMGYAAWTIGNHEFNFGKDIFTAVLSQAGFPTLQANVSDDGQYGLATVPVEPYTEKTVGPEGIKIAILGIGNHRIPNYELPSNIPGLTFSDPLVTAQQLSTKMRPVENLVSKVKYFYKEGLIKKAGIRNSLLDKLAYVQAYIDAGNTAAAVSKLKAFINEVKAQKGKAITAYAANSLISLATWAQKHPYDDDLVLALTHIGFTENPGSIEVDKNVDTNLAATVTGVDAIVGGHSHTDPSKQTAASGSYMYLPAIVEGPGHTPVIINHAYRYNNYLGELFLGFRATADGYKLVSRAGQYIAVTSSTPEDPEIKAIVDPYAALLASYNTKVVGQTTVPIDTTNAYVAETNAANLQADASVWELAQHGINADVHLSGAMTRPSSPSNWVMFPTATAATPASIKVSDMFTLMPYENSLVVLNMNGPQLKAVLERAYRNYYYYKYVPGYGGYSYYTTCMLDTNEVGQITYDEKGTGGPTPPLPDGSNVVSFAINGAPVDFADATKYYKVSTVNYLAAGSCNFNNGGVSLWPLGQLANDTQYYVRDAVINYIDAMDVVAPVVEDRLVFIP